MNNKTIFYDLTKSFKHPSTLLWRTVELQVVKDNISNIKLKHPILDLGCGEGNITRIVFGKGVVDLGLDNWPEMILLAKKSSIYKKVVLGDARNLQFKSETFQTVFSNSVIEHIEGIEQVIFEVSRILKKGGYFIFTVPNNNLDNNLFPSVIFEKLHLPILDKIYARIVDNNLCHINLFSEHKWKELLNRHSLKLIVSKSYLARKQIMIWDLFRLVFFILRPLESVPILSIMVELLKKKSTNYAEHLIEIPITNNKTGSAFLFIAQKNNGN